MTDIVAAAAKACTCVICGFNLRKLGDKVVFNPVVSGGEGHSVAALKGYALCAEVSQLARIYGAAGGFCNIHAVAAYVADFAVFECEIPDIVADYAVSYALFDVYAFNRHIFRAAYIEKRLVEGDIFD